MAVGRETFTEGTEMDIPTRLDARVTPLLRPHFLKVQIILVEADGGMKCLLSTRHGHW